MLVGASALAEQTEDTKSNILLIVSDDTGYGALFSLPLERLHLWRPELVSGTWIRSFGKCLTG